MKTLFVLNPRSGRRRTRDVLQSVIESVYPETGNEFTIHRCERVEDLDEVISSALAESCQVIFAVGGDGTVREVARRLIGTSAILGILPTGSGNGLARHLQISLSPEEALRAISESKVEEIDTAVVNDLPFLNVAGIGFDAVVAERFAASTVRGLETYVREGLKVFSSHAVEHYDIAIDGQTLRESAFVVAVANASQYGHNARIAPLASLQDGLLDLSLVHSGSVFAAPMLLQQLFSGRLHESPYVTTYKAASVTIRRSSAGPAHVDGEPALLPDTLEFAIRPRSLRVLVPAAATPL